MEKPKSQVQVQSFKEDVGAHQKSREANALYWQPGYVKQFPLLGFGSILLVLLCALASVAVLVVSDHKSSTQWTQRLAPNVVLSALNAISNLALVIAVTRGASIAWWRRAMDGATVTQLHNSWGQTSSSYEVLKNLFRLDTIGIAALAAKLAVVDGILFQRSTTTYVGQDPARNITMLGVAATAFPQTGYVVSDGFGAQTNCECFMIGDVYTPVVNNWETSNGFFEGFNKLFQTCGGTCFASIEAIGFEVECNKEQHTTNIAQSALATYKATGGDSANASAWSNLPIFNSSFSVTFANESRNYSTIDLSLLYFQSEDPYNPSSATCPGTVFSVQCALRPALVTYPLTITNYTNEHIINGVSLGIFNTDSTPDTDEVLNAPETIYPYSFTDKQIEGFTVGAYLNPNEDLSLNSTTHLGGIANALSQFLSSTASITYTGAEIWALKQQGTLAQTMMYGPPNMGSCDCSFRGDSALDTIVNAINQLTFLTATGMIDTSTWSFPKTDQTSILSRASSTNTPAMVNSSMTVTVQGIGQNTTANFRSLVGTQEIRDVPHYKTDYVYMGLGAGLTFVCVLLILPIYWKYGELGRPVTLGPIEIASAFGAPILNTSARQAGTVATKEQLPPTPLSPTFPTSPIVPQIAFANVEELLKEVGDRKVTYRFVDVEEPVNVSGSPPSSPTTTTHNRRSVLAFQDFSDLNARPVSGVVKPHSPQA